MAAILSQARQRIKREVPTDGLVVRVVALAIAVWTDIAVGWSGAPAAVWLVGIVLVTAGHGFSWRFRDWSSPLRALMVAVGVVAVLFFMRGSVFAVASGTMLPAAHLMVVFQGVAAFELRSRGGIYASLAMSGLVFYFVSLQALDITFSVFVIGFAVLILAFLAVSFMWDRVKDADVEWFKSDFATAGLWSTVAVLVLLATIAGFLIMPTDIQAGTSEPNASVLPLRGDEAVEFASAPDEAEPLANPFEDAFGSGVADDLATQSDAGLSPDPGSSSAGDGLIDASLDASLDASGDAAFGLDGEARADADGPGGPDRALSDAGVDPASQGLSQSTDSPGGDPSGDPGDAGSVTSPGTGVNSLYLGGDETTVMNVRTPVVSYWRGATYDRFEDGRWRLDPAYRYNAFDVRRNRRSFQGDNGWLYSQTFFVHRPIPNGEVFSGYDVKGITAPSVQPANAGVGETVVYKALSDFPDFTPSILDGARPVTLGSRYEDVPGDLLWLRPVAVSVTQGSVTDFQRASKITAFLKDGYEFDGAAPDQLALRWPLADFLRSHEPATAMDFATAAVMLNRSAGVPSRLVTGYLPGTFDHLSGTYVVSETDRHVWAEVYLSRGSEPAAWVPFDPTPRPELTAFAAGGSNGAAPLQRLFESSYGDDIIDGLSDSPQLLARAVASTFKTAIGPALSAAGAILGIAALIWIIWKLHLPELRRRREQGYSSLDGEARIEMRELYRKAERLISGAGVGPRLAWQTAGEYSASARVSHESAGGEIEWFRQVAESAAYDPEPFDDGLVVEGQVRLRNLRRALRSSPPGDDLRIALDGQSISERRRRLGLGKSTGTEGWGQLGEHGRLSGKREA